MDLGALCFFLVATQVFFVIAGTISCAWIPGGVVVRVLIFLCLGMVIPLQILAWGLLCSISFTVLVALAASALTLSSAGAAWSRYRSSRALELRRAAFGRAWSSSTFELAGAFFACILLAAVQVFGAFIKPEGSIDGLLYHGPVIGNVLVTNSLFGWESVNEYVYYSDVQMLYSAVLAKLTQEVRLEDAGQAIYFAILPIAIAVLSRPVRKQWGWAIASSLVAVAAPVAWSQGRVLYADVAACALVVAAVALFDNFRCARRFWLMPVPFVILGTASAVKPSLLIASVILALVMFLILLIISARYWWTAASIALFGLSSAPFLLRNYLEFGNPLYPVKFLAFGKTFEGKIDTQIFYTTGQRSGILNPLRFLDFVNDLWYGILHGPDRWLYDPREGGFGRLVVALVIVLLVLLVLHILGSFRVRRQRGAGFWWSAGLIVLATFLAVASQANAIDSRYLMLGYFFLVSLLVSLIQRFVLTRPMRGSLVALMIVITGVSVVSAEGKMLYGIRESLDIRARDSSYGLTNNTSNPSYANTFAWTDRNGCIRVAVETRGGLTSSGMPPESLMNAYQYGYWGSSLCNNIVVFPMSVRPSDELSALGKRWQGRDYFLVIYDNRSNLSRWDLSIAKQGLSSAQVVRVAGHDGSYFPLGQVVLRISGN